MSEKIEFADAAAWKAEAERRFGDKVEDWRFRCPRCGRVSSGREYKEAGAQPDDIYNQCIGRFDKTKGCDWAAFGLFDICKTHVAGQPVFDFDDVRKKYSVKLHNFPLRWEVEAGSEAEAQAKGWEAIKKDMEPASVAAGGFIEVEEVQDESHSG